MLIGVPKEIKNHEYRVGAVLIPGKLAPKLIRRSDIQQMRPGSVVVDVAIDQGGSCETSRPTTHAGLAQDTGHEYVEPLKLLR